MKKDKARTKHKGSESHKPDSSLGEKRRGILAKIWALPKLLWIGITFLMTLVGSIATYSSWYPELSVAVFTSRNPALGFYLAFENTGAFAIRDLEIQCHIQLLEDDHGRRLTEIISPSLRIDTLSRHSAVSRPCLKGIAMDGQVKTGRIHVIWSGSTLLGLLGESRKDTYVTIAQADGSIAWLRNLR